MGRAKVFGIGLNKTGTSSLTQAMTLLGYSAMHHELPNSHLRPREVSEAIDYAVAEGRPPLHYVPEMEAYDAFFDVRAIERHFPAFDAQYPGSRFILHLRNVDDWIESRVAHVWRNVQNHPERRWRTPERDRWRGQWFAHIDRVLEYFEGREGDLLQMDVVSGDGWEVLAPFLGVPVPDEPFPWANRAPTRWRLALRRLRHPKKPRR